MVLPALQETQGLEEVPAIPVIMALEEQVVMVEQEEQEVMPADLVPQETQGITVLVVLVVVQGPVVTAVGLPMQGMHGHGNNGVVQVVP
jgi:hypothetical protein